MSILSGLGADRVFYYFEEICKIPHGSGNEMALSDFIVAFAKERGLYVRQDESYNVLVKKSGTTGYEKSPALIMQGHIDMVCEKNADTEKDFLTDPIDIYTEGDFIHAKGTTLGADDGIAVAYMLAVLDSSDMPHPPVECVFTVGEEVGMEGAVAFDVFDMKGKMLLNLDTEEEGVLLAGCSGGRRMRVHLPAHRTDAPKEKQAYQVAIRGLKGGHSGAEIHLQRANADCLMGRLLSVLRKTVDFDLVSVDGGNMDNAICREADAVILLDKKAEAEVEDLLRTMEKTFREEYNVQDPSITIKMEALREEVFQVLTEETKNNVIALLLLLPQGVVTMSMDMEGLVESSSNIGILKTTAEDIFVDNALRSSVESRKEEMAAKVECIAKLCGATVENLNDYPGWKYDPDSSMRQLFADLYKKTTGKAFVVSAIHAGLECGLFADKIPDLDIASIGPQMYDIHTPDERLSISSTVRVWEFIKEVLKELK